MDPSLSWSSTEDVISQFSPAHDNDTEISSGDIIKSKGNAPESSSDNELEAGSELREWTGNTLNYANSPKGPTLGPYIHQTGLSSFVSRIDGFKYECLHRSFKILEPARQTSAMQPRRQSPSTSQKYKYITVKAKAGEDKEKMNIHEAICLCCFRRFNADNVLKTKCKCKKFALIHDGCQSGKDCGYCKQPIEYIPVTLLSEDSHPTSSDGKGIRRSRVRMLFNKLACGRG